MDKGFWAGVLYMLMAAVVLGGVIGGIIFVLIHFIMKFW